MGGFNKERPLMDLYFFIGNRNEGMTAKTARVLSVLSTKSSATNYVHVQTPTTRGPRSFIEALPEGVSWETAGIEMGAT